jgi:uncharacterized membrane protein YqgA involved in biofilm formation
MRGLGTLLNVAAIAAGASAGTLPGDRLPGRLRDTLVAALGLFTLALGVQQALAAFGDELAGAVGRPAPLLVRGALLAAGLVAAIR